MPIAREHELHHRRLGRNVGLAVSLGSFVLVVFAVSMVKMKVEIETLTGANAPAPAVAEQAR
jgi:hypothetical protein